MGLTSDITEDLQAEFDGELSDAVKVCNVIQNTPTYDPNTGLTSDSEVSTATRGVIELVDSSMVDGEAIKYGDYSFVILVAECLVIPQLGDQIEYNSERYHINVILIDPADVAWAIVARKL